MARTIIEKELSKIIREVDFDFVECGNRSLSEIYEAVIIQYPNLCNNDFLCCNCCSSSNYNPEWTHVVYDALSFLKNKDNSRVQKLANNQGYWYFGEIIEL